MNETYTVAPEWVCVFVSNMRGGEFLPTSGVVSAIGDIAQKQLDYIGAPGGRDIVYFRRESAQRLPNIQDRVFVHWGDILAYNKSKEDD